MAAYGNELSLGGLEAPSALTPSDTDIPAAWASCFYLLSHSEQAVLAFAWLHWWLQSSKEEEPGFAGWLHKGPGFALNHASLLSVLTQRCEGVLGTIHGLLDTILEQAGDWDGDRVTGHEVVKLLEELDTEYRCNVHDRELWPAVFQLVQQESSFSA
jgi:hypothetical protein